MEVKCSQGVDILLVRLSDESFDYAEETNGVIAHFSSEGKPVLLEVQGARKFLLSSITTNLVKWEEDRLS